MPVTFSIRKSLGVFCAQFYGFVLIEDCLSSLQALAAHPDFRPNLNQLIDLSEVTDYERNFVRILEFFARMPESGFAPGQEFLVVYYAPAQAGQELARIAIRSWEGVPGPVLRMVGDPDQALAILGLSHVALQDLHAAADGSRV